MRHECASPGILTVSSNKEHAVFSVAFRLKTSEAQLRIMTLDGKLIATIPFGPVTGPSIYSCEWSFENAAGTGIYICTLLVDGISVHSQTISIRR
ncbi:MAG: hypothetical protein JW863_20795 [Chitinispirillaceae bacterium]|nr:hypothetical protein [Chitinispirillaceae bacterium]